MFSLHKRLNTSELYLYLAYFKKVVILDAEYFFGGKTLDYRIYVVNLF